MDETTSIASDDTSHGCQCNDTSTAVLCKYHMELMEDADVDAWFAHDDVQSSILRENDAAEAARVSLTINSSRVIDIESTCLAHRLEVEEEDNRLLELALQEEERCFEEDKRMCAAAAERRRQQWRYRVAALCVSSNSIPSLVILGGGKGVPSLLSIAAVAIATSGFRGRRLVSELSVPYDIAMFVQKAADALDTLPLSDVDERVDLPALMMGPALLGKRIRNQ